MCTLVAAFQVFSRRPLVVAANRDEQLARPALPPRLFEDAPHAYVAPVDVKAQGTWIGLNAQRLLVAITNRFGVLPEAGRPSRGLLVRDALQQSSARALRSWMQSFPPERANAFHLFYSDAREAFVSWSDGSVIRHRTLETGLHVFTERSLGAHLPDREANVQTLWAASQPSALEPNYRGLETMLSHHAPSDELGSTCVHAPSFKYGTRSSTLWGLGPSWDESELFAAEGPPCETGYHSLSPLLLALGRS